MSAFGIAAHTAPEFSTLTSLIVMVCAGLLSRFFGQGAEDSSAAELKLELLDNTLVK